jgi:hypothetical protein
MPRLTSRRTLEAAPSKRDGKVGVMVSLFFIFICILTFPFYFLPEVDGDLEIESIATSGLSNRQQNFRR